MAMTQLGVRFSDDIKIYLSNTANDLDLNSSEVARAALNIGLNAIKKEAHAFEDRGEDKHLVRYYIDANQ